VVEEMHWSVDGEVSQRTLFSDFTQTGGIWWPGTISREATAQPFGRTHRTHSVTKVRVEALDASELADKVAGTLAVRDTALLFGPGPQDVAAAKQAAEFIDVTYDPLPAAVDTADAIQNTRHRLPHNPNLREFDFGDWDGLHHSDVTARDPDLVRRFWETPGDLAAPGGESWNMVAARVSAAIDAIITRNPRRDIIAVAHIGVIMTQIQRASGCTAYQAMSHQIANFSITEIQMWPIRGIARINHLP